MKKLIVLLLFPLMAISQLKQIATFTESKIKIVANVTYYFEDADILRPISSDVLGWSLTNKTTLSDYLNANFPNNAGIGITTPNIATSPNISGYRKLYYYDSFENKADWHYLRNGVTLPNHFTLLANAKKLIKPNFVPPVQPPVVVTPPVVTPPVVVVSPVTPPVVVVPPVATPPIVNTTPKGTEDLTPSANNAVILEPLGGGSIHELNDDGSIGKILMDIDKVALKNLILTDKAWFTNTLIGYEKRWKYGDYGEWRTTPLQNLVISDRFLNKPISVKIAFFKNGDATGKADLMQKTIFVVYNNSVTTNIPNWFSLGVGVPNATFHKDPKFPKNFTVPKGKLTMMEGEMDAEMRLNDGVYLGDSPLFQYGFTHVSREALPAGCKYTAQGKYFTLMTAANQWEDPAVNSNLSQLGTVICDSEFEYRHPPKETGDSFARRVLSYPFNAGKYLGRWDFASNSKSWLYNSGPIGVIAPSGVYSKQGAKLWRDEYNNTSSTGSGFNLSIPSFYTRESIENDWYEIFQSCEVGQKRDPNIKQVLSLWGLGEVIDDKESNPKVWTNVNGTVRLDEHKVPTSAEYMYSSALISAAIFDGYYHFGDGARFTNDINYYERAYYAPYYNGYVKSKNVNGVDIKCIYFPRYYGLYNYVALANWEISQEPYKSIIEANTKWQLVEMAKGDTNLMTYVGDDMYPSYGVRQLNNTPIIRAKYSEDGKQVIYIAVYPSQELTSSTWSFKIPNSTWSKSITLDGSWANMGVINL